MAENPDTENTRVALPADLQLSSPQSDGLGTTTLDPLSFSFLMLRQALEQYVEEKRPSSLAALLQAEPDALSQLGEKFQKKQKKSQGILAKRT